MLNIAFIVVEGTVLPCLQFECILDHFLVQPVQDCMINHVFQHHKAVSREHSNRDLKIALVEPPGLYFGR